MRSSIVATCTASRGGNRGWCARVQRPRGVPLGDGENLRANLRGGAVDGSRGGALIG